MALASVCSDLGLPTAAAACVHAALGATLRVQYLALLNAKLQTAARHPDPSIQVLLSGAYLP